MNNSFYKVLKVVWLLILLTFFTSCSSNVPFKDMAYIDHKNLVGTNSFESLVDSLIKKQELKVKKIVGKDVVLVSDFVNLDRLKNRSKLGFLLAEHLKNSLSNRNITVREVELGKQFEFGQSGFNILTRKQENISNQFVDNNFALVGTYSITTESLIIFIKLIDINNGNILSSASGSTLIDNEIKELERANRNPVIITPMVL